MTSEPAIRSKKFLIRSDTRSGLPRPESHRYPAIDGIENTPGAAVQSPARLLRLGLLAALLCLGTAASGCAARLPRNYRLVPSPTPAYSIENGTVSIKSDAFHLSVMPLDDLARAAFIRTKAQGATDPLSSGGAGDSPGYSPFPLSSEILAAKYRIVFHPQTFFLPW